MRTATELQQIVDEWATNPDPEEIRRALTQEPERYALATMCADTQLDLPEELIQLVLEVVEADPMAERIIESLFAAALDEKPMTVSTAYTLATTITDRPDSTAFQRILASSLVDILFDEKAECPAQMKERLAEAASTLAAELTEPAFAAVFLAHALTQPDPDTLSLAVRRCWERAVQLPDEVLYPISYELAGLIDIDRDPTTALEAARTALALSAEHALPEQDPIDSAFLNLVVIEALARQDRPAAIAHAESILAQDPRLENSPVAESWSLLLWGYLCDLAQQECPPRQILPLADRLVQNRCRWPSDPDIPVYFGLVLARIYLAANAPGLARPWADLAVDLVKEVPELEAEARMLQVQAAFHEGRTGELDPLLRQAAQVVADSGDREHRLAWAQIVTAISRVRQDHTLIPLTEQAQSNMIGSLHDPTGGYLPDQLRAGYAFAHRLMEVHERFLAGQTGASTRDLAVNLATEITEDDHAHLAIGAHLYACVLECSNGDIIGARRHLDEVAAGLRRQREDPVGGFPIVYAEQVERFLRLLLDPGGGGAVQQIAQLNRIRHENEAKGRTELVYMATRALMLLHTSIGDHKSAMTEGINALSFHTNRAVTIPDARERATLREDFSELAAATFRAALADHQPRTAAEILEIVRAQPVPIARLEVPGTEQPMLRLVALLLGGTSSSDTAPWTGTWSPVAAAEPDLPPETEETTVLLTGLPSIRMPWGAALQDRLRDPRTEAVGHVVVPREGIG